MSTLSQMEQLFKAMADRNRLRILAALQGGPLCVCQLMGVLGLSQSTVSKHLAILKEAGLLLEEQRGKRTYYSLSEEFASPSVRGVVNAVLNGLKDSPELAEDQRLAEFMREFRIETVEAALNVRKKRSLLRVLQADS
ncbi:MAG: metalloregulator ArsR/SmtB family transcription factor [Armatimonadota bacterium]|nr:metalloregulator ArsR/SmtB family transcription factor [bacterium]MCS7310268.1 metalloregulator ArsR/SmtB family transcription factor [Armatimonadota bacterium]MDW8103913.1 metalloregulator ArsR/SmtB family transcription factor [Armatimonadota bacterium]MDW8289658.1 metalloregulator ArsR/SmtB family transcription factor [Armatimonadota bacterium]